MARCPSTRTAVLTTADAEIASPCPGGGPEFADNERISFCNLCSKNVHNLSGMTEAEARAVVDSDAEICIRYVADDADKIALAPPRPQQGIGRLLGAAAMSLVFMSQPGCSDAGGSPNAGVKKRGLVSKIAQHVTELVFPPSKPYPRIEGRGSHSRGGKIRIGKRKAPERVASDRAERARRASQKAAKAQARADARRQATANSGSDR